MVENVSLVMMGGGGGFVSRFVGVLIRPSVVENVALVTTAGRGLVLVDELVLSSCSSSSSLPSSWRGVGVGNRVQRVVAGCMVCIGTWKVTR